MAAVGLWAIVCWLLIQNILNSGSVLKIAQGVLKLKVTGLYPRDFDLFGLEPRQARFPQGSQVILVYTQIEGALITCT